MKIGPSFLTAALVAGGCAFAQAPKASKAPDAPKPKAAKESIEATFARKNLDDVLNAVNGGWFGKTYENINAVDVNGDLSITYSAAAANAKAEQVTQGAVKGATSKGGTVNLRVKGVYFANADFRTEFSGDFGSGLYYRSGLKGFLYSKEMNAYTTKVDPPPADAPQTFLGWFAQCVNDIRNVYVKGTVFKAALGREGAAGEQTILFSAQTGAYDPKKREQSMAESLGFWKRGKLEVTFDKSTHLPKRMEYSNQSQGVATTMTFAYNGSRPTGVTIANQSRGMEGPASLTLSYNNDGRIDHMEGQMGFPVGNLKFDLNFVWSGDKKPSSIATIPPLGATKKGGEELQTMLLVNLAGKMLDLQKGGFNLRSVSLATAGK